MQLSRGHRIWPLGFKELRRDQWMGPLRRGRLNVFLWAVVVAAAAATDAAAPAAATSACYCCAKQVNEQHVFLWAVVVMQLARGLDSRDGPLACPESQLFCVADLRILR